MTYSVRRLELDVIPVRWISLFAGSGIGFAARLAWLTRTNRHTVLSPATQQVVCANLVLCGNAKRL